MSKPNAKGVETAGSWACATYEIEDERSIRPHVLHPLIAKWRVADIKDRYGCVPKVRRRYEAYVDFGGMVHIDEPWITAKLSGKRTIKCMAHHASTLVEKLTKAKPVVVRGQYYYRISAWHSIIYFSGADRRQIIHQFDNDLADRIADEHRQKMLDALDDAQGKPRGTVKAMLEQYLQPGTN